MVKPHGEKFYGISYRIAILIMVTGIVGVNKDEHIIQRRFCAHVVIADDALDGHALPKPDDHVIVVPSKKS